MTVGEGLSHFQGETVSVSHELAEAITDPDVATGWYNSSLGGGEITDLVNYVVYQMDGYAVSSQWSNVLRGPAHAVGTGSTDLAFDQIAPPAVTSFNPVGGPVATFTTANTSLTPSAFTATVVVYTGGSTFNWPVTLITGGNGHFVVNAKPPSGFNAGTRGVKFDGTNVGIYLHLTDTVDATPTGNPIAIRYVPFSVQAAGSATPFTYNADNSGSTHNYRLTANGGNFELYDGTNLVFRQAIVDTGAIAIGADPAADSSLTIDYSGGAFANSVSFNGGSGTAAHTLKFLNANGHLATTHTSATSGTVTLGGQIVTLTNVAGLVGNGPPIAFAAPAAGQVGIAYAVALAASGGSGGPYTFTLASGTLPPGLTLTPGGQLGGRPTAAGTFGFSILVDAANGDFTTIPVAIAIQPTALPPSTVGQQFAIGPDAGSHGQISLYNSDRSVRFTATPFPGFTGGIRTAAADFNGDGVADLVVGTGPGGASHVQVIDGKTQAVLFAVDPFETAFTGGVYVAAGDLTGDGRADLVITPDRGGGPRCRIYSGNGFGLIADFFGIDDPNFRGGARATIGDINGDGIGDLIVAAGFGGGPRIAIFNGATLFNPVPEGQLPPKLLGDFTAFEPGLRNGVFVAAGDVDGDGKADLVVGAGPGGGPRVSVFAGSDLLNNVQTRTADFFAGDASNRGGVRVAVKNLDSDAHADLLTGSGTGGGSQVTSYPGASLVGATPPTGFVLDAFAGALGGVFVG